MNEVAESLLEVARSIKSKYAFDPFFRQMPVVMLSRAVPGILSED